MVMTMNEQRLIRDAVQNPYTTTRGAFTAARIRGYVELSGGGLPRRTAKGEEYFARLKDAP